MAVGVERFGSLFSDLWGFSKVSIFLLVCYFDCYKYRVGVGTTVVAHINASLGARTSIFDIPVRG